MSGTQVLQQAEADGDPQRFSWYGVWALLMAVSALPMLGIVRVPLLFGYVPTLVVHELAAFCFFGHTVFSNIWSLRIRSTQPLEFGLWARRHMRLLCLSVTAPTAVIVPLCGLMLIENWGGLVAVPWAWDAYFMFWLMAGFSIIPDVIRYARNRNADRPMHGMVNGGIRGVLALFVTFYIIIWCMVARHSLFAQPLQSLLGISG